MEKHILLIKYIEDDKFSSLFFEFTRKECSGEILQLYSEIKKLALLVKEDEIKKKIEEINNQFIKEGSKSEINLSFQEKEEIVVKLKEINNENFKSLKMIIISNLLDSFIRFTKTEEYNKYMKNKNSRLNTRNKKEYAFNSDILLKKEQIFKKKWNFNNIIIQNNDNRKKLIEEMIKLDTYQHFLIKE